MNKTKVDYLLIEMITPKIKEIEEKFAKGQGLEQEDINTLLLKSQYNHINHLDEKLNEVTADVSSLKGDFKLLEERVNNKMNNLENKFDTFKAEVREDVSNIKIDIANLKTDIEKSIKETIKWYIGGVGLVIVALKLLDVFVKGN